MIRIITLLLFALVAGAASKDARKAQPAEANPTDSLGIPHLPRPSPQFAPPRTIEYQPDDIPTIHAKIRYATIVILPAAERVVETVCGDKDWWQITPIENLVYIKPVKADIATDLTLLGKTGTLYTFALHEITESPGSQPDLKVTIHWPQTLQQTIVKSGPQFFSKAEHDSIVEDYQQQLQAASQAVRDLQTAAKNVLKDEITRMRTDYPAELQFDYNIALNTKPFYVRTMYADRKFTYLKLDAPEAPAIYEIKDGKPNLVAFDYVNGTFIIRKVVDQGYLAIGRAKLHFSTKGRQ